MKQVESQLFTAIDIGEEVSCQRTFELNDLAAWHSAFSNVIPEGHFVSTDAAMGLLSSQFSALVGSGLPGPGSQIVTYSLQLKQPLPLDTAITLTLRVREKLTTVQHLILDARASTPEGDILAEGAFEVRPSATEISEPYSEHQLDSLLEQAKQKTSMRTGVVYPLSGDALEGAIDAANSELIEPIFYAPREALQALAAQNNIDISAYEIVDVKDDKCAASTAAHDAGSGKLQALMKGSLHTDVLLHAVMEADAGLRTGQLLSHVALISSPAYSRRFVITDVALNIAPTLDQKCGIAQNAINFLRGLGVTKPKVAVIAAVEVVNSKMQATLDGAVLAKMADRGQIVGGLVDGPLDLDAAVDARAAQIKKIISPVAGQADILLMPNIETGNAVYKALGFTADAQSAGLIVGARVPVILTSRADTPAVRRFSAAVAVLYADALAHSQKSGSA